MRKLIIGIAMCSTALASPALARDGQSQSSDTYGPIDYESMTFVPPVWRLQVDPARVQAPPTNIKQSAVRLDDGIVTQASTTLAVMEQGSDDSPELSLTRFYISTPIVNAQAFTSAYRWNQQPVIGITATIRL